MTTAAPGTARSSGPLATAWFITALVVGPVGFLLFALSEGSGDRLLGVLLAGAGVLAGATGAVALTSRGTVRRWSLGLSAAMVALGVVGAAVALLSTPAFVEDALLLGLPPVLGGLVLEHFWWGAVFLLALPVMVALLVLGPIVLPEYKDPNAGRLDLISVGLSILAVLAFPAFRKVVGVGRELDAMLVEGQSGFTDMIRGAMARK